MASSSTKKETPQRVSGSLRKKEEEQTFSQRRTERRSGFFKYPTRSSDEVEKEHDYDPRNNKNFKKRKAEAHLKRDRNWNGPRDELFFTIFEHYLDQLISRVVILKREDPENADEMIQSECIETIEFSSPAKLGRPSFANLKL
jgi:hypothetical protein